MTYAMNLALFVKMVISWDREMIFSCNSIIDSYVLKIFPPKSKIVFYKRILAKNANNVKIIIQTVKISVSLEQWIIVYNTDTITNAVSVRRTMFYITINAFMLNSAQNIYYNTIMYTVLNVFKSQDYLFLWWRAPIILDLIAFKIYLQILVPQ